MLWWLLGGAVLLVLLVIGAVVAVMGVGWMAFSGQARTALQADPLIQEHIGTIEDMSVDFLATGNAEGSDEFVFRVKGSLASGRVRGEFISDGPNNEILTDGLLTLDDGREFALPSSHADSALEADDFDNLFVRQAQAAVQRYPLTASHLGRIERFTLDTDASMDAPGMMTFVFDVVGSDASGTISADFITVDADTERLGEGTLTLSDGRRIVFEGESSLPQQNAGVSMPADFAPQSSDFVQQAIASLSAHPLVQEHIGDLQQALIDREASWSAYGDVYVFDLVGSKGSGRLEAEFITIDADTEQMGEGSLVLADGRTLSFDGE